MQGKGLVSECKTEVKKKAGRGGRRWSSVAVVVVGGERRLGDVEAARSESPPAFCHNPSLA